MHQANRHRCHLSPIDLVKNASQFSVRSRRTPASKCMSRLSELYCSHTSQGASAQILLYGATVVSWKSPSSSEGGVPQERLFVSSKSALDGSKPVSCFESRYCARSEPRSRSEGEFLWSSRSSDLLHVLKIPSWPSMGSAVRQSGSGRTSIPPHLTKAA